MEGENTEGKLKTIHIKPRMHTTEMRRGRLIDACIAKLVIWIIGELEIFDLSTHQILLIKYTIIYKLPYLFPFTTFSISLIQQSSNWTLSLPQDPTVMLRMLEQIPKLLLLI